MARKPTYAELESRHSQMERERTLYLQSIQDLAHDACQYIGTRKLADGQSYTYKVSRPTGAMGGILYITYRCDGQSPSTTVTWLEESYQTMQANQRLGVAESWEGEYIGKAQRYAWQCQRNQDNVVS